MEIKPDTTESKLLKGYYKTAYSPVYGYVGIRRAIYTADGRIWVYAIVQNQNGVVPFDYTELNRYCF
jgi:hypothetical protein